MSLMLGSTTGDVAAVVSAVVALLGLVAAFVLSLRARLAPLRLGPALFSIDPVSGGTVTMVVVTSVQNTTRNDLTLSRLELFARPSRLFRLRHPRWKTRGGVDLVVPQLSSLTDRPRQIGADDSVPHGFVVRGPHAATLADAHPMVLAAFGGRRPATTRVHRAKGMLSYPKPSLP